MLRNRQLISRFHQAKSSRLLYLASVFIFFWVVFDGILSYIVPILVTQRGYSNTQMGLILASSSFAGAIFDFVLSRFLRRSGYLQTFLLVLLVSLCFPLVLWSANHIFVYLLAMAIWGLYYDLYNFASYDFVSRNLEGGHNHSSQFAIIELFRSVGNIVAPVFAAWLIIDQVEFSNLTISYVFLVIAAILYLFLVISSPTRHLHLPPVKIKPPSFSQTVFLWQKIGRILLPVLSFMVTLQVFDAIFWTIGPLFSESFPNFPHFSGLLMVLYSLPSLFTAWKIKGFTSRFGQKHTAYFTLLVGSLLLLPIGYISSPVIILLLVFVSSIATSITWPAIEGAIADYVSETSVYKSEIEGLTDLSTNLGYVIGPILAGVLSDKFGVSHSFTALGIINTLTILVLFVVTPKQINVRI